MNMYLKLYEVEQLEAEIDKIAQENNGEIPLEKLQELVVSHTTSLESIKKLCGYAHYLDSIELLGKEEINKIKSIMDSAKKRKENLINFMKPYIIEEVSKQKKSKSFKVGARYTLGLRSSERVEVDENLLDKRFVRIKTIIEPDKTSIKEAIKSGQEVVGARLIKEENAYVN